MAAHPAPAQRRAAHRRRLERRRQHRIRRFALLTVILVVLVVTLSLTAFGGGTMRVATITPAPSQRLLPAGLPQPTVIAKLDTLRIQLPIATSVVTALGFHGAGDNALALQPVGRQGNEGLLARLGHKLFGGGGGGPTWYQIGGGGGPQAGGLDIGAAPNSEVYAPVDGRIVGVTPYVLNGKPYGVRIDIQPARAPSVVVSLTHITATDGLSVGSTVTASTTKLGSVLDLTGVERQSLARYTNDSGNHVAIEVHPAATLSLG